MYGWINYITEQLVVEKFGEKAWEAIKAKTNVTKTDFLMHDYRPDSVTIDIVMAAAEVLKVGADDVLEIWGGYFVEFLIRTQQDQLLHVMGTTLPEFISNLDYIHTHLQMSFPEASFPHFRCQDVTEEPLGKEMSGGDPPSLALQLHYESTRGSLLAPLVKGILKNVARIYFSLEINIDQVQTLETGAVFHIWAPGPSSPRLKPSTSFLDAAELEDSGFVRSVSQSLGDQTAEETKFIVEEFGIGSEVFIKRWPWFMLMDSQLRMKAAGSSLTRIFSNLAPERHFLDNFVIVRPQIHGDTLADILDRKTVAFTLRTKPDLGGMMELRGEMVEVKGSQGQGLLFLGGPRINGLEEMLSLNVHLSDIPLHDATRDLVYMMEHRNAEARLLHRIDAMGRQLAEEKQKSEDVLYSLLPRSVVSEIRAGNRVTSRSYPDVTVLFADIVGFTEMSSTADPQAIFGMLDQLYTVFDRVSSYFDVFKVGTVGDAYLIAGGLPMKNNKHASAVADMAFAMRSVGSFVTNPENGKPLRIRIGMHSGGVMAGVVGAKMPTYCIFGDTVNTASRMESTGEALKIQCSETTAQKLADDGYILETRGTQHVKGKGTMTTYWIKEQPARALATHRTAVNAAKAALQSMTPEINTKGPDEMANGSTNGGLSFKTKGAQRFMLDRPWSPKRPSVKGENGTERSPRRRNSSPPGSNRISTVKGSKLETDLEDEMQSPMSNEETRPTSTGAISPMPRCIDTFPPDPNFQPFLTLSRSASRDSFNSTTSEPLSSFAPRPTSPTTHLHFMTSSTTSKPSTPKLTTVQPGSSNHNSPKPSPIQRPVSPGPILQRRSSSTPQLIPPNIPSRPNNQPPPSPHASSTQHSASASSQPSTPRSSSVEGSIITRRRSSALRVDLESENLFYPNGDSAVDVPHPSKPLDFNRMFAKSHFRQSGQPLNPSAGFECPFSATAGLAKAGANGYHSDFLKPQWHSMSPTWEVSSQVEALNLERASSSNLEKMSIKSRRTDSIRSASAPSSAGDGRKQNWAPKDSVDPTSDINASHKLESVEAGVMVTGGVLIGIFLTLGLQRLFAKP